MHHGSFAHFLHRSCLSYVTVFWTFEHVFDAGFKSVYPMAIDGAGEGNRTSRQFSVSESSCGKKELLVGYDTLYIAALERVRGKVSARQFQIFDLVVNKGWRPADVAKLVGVTLVSLYVTRHRIGAAIKREAESLEAQLEEAASRPAFETKTELTDPKVDSK